MVFKTNSAINQFLWLFFAAFHRAKPFHIRDQMLINSKTKYNAGFENKSFTEFEYNCENIMLMVNNIITHDSKGY